MDFHSNLEYLCRVCAANTKGKNSVPECAYILKTPGLKDKLDRFLYLKIFENDALPKVLCKSCFRQVEATASLSKIAKHTQQVFRDFLLSNLPKGPPETTKKNSDKNKAEAINRSDIGDKLNKEDKNESSTAKISLVQLQTQSAGSIPAQIKPVAAAAPLRKDDVVVNVSVTDPLTRDNQQKMISNSQRRQSLLIDSRYTPKSIAQKTPATIQKITPPKAAEIINTTNNQKTITTPPLNFFPFKTPANQTVKQLLPTTTQITTFSSGGYVIGRPTANNDQQELKKNHLPLASTADNVLQQKRKNLVKALNNIKANNSGQVSLLKSSHQKQSTSANQNSNKTPSTEVVSQAVDDELPERIIIAAPKNKLLEKPKGKEPLNLSGKQQVIPAIPAIPQMPTTTATITPIIPQTEQLLPFAKPGFPDDILLGRVIRDMDLLKLILKALKWPVNKQNMELQLQRLKDTKFTDIMSDSNLLQDTDLTQLLGPYLAPVLLAAQVMQQQQQQLLNTASINQQNLSAALLAQAQAQGAKPMSAIDAVQAEINKSIPYKLPPETSVQLVPATPEETETTKSPVLANINSLLNSSSNASKNLKRERQKNKTVEESAPPKRQRRAAAQKARDSIVISDEDDDESEEEIMPKPKQRSAKTAPNLQFELNANLMSQFGLLNGSSTANDANTAALMAFLQGQKTALMKNKKVQRRRRNSVSNLVTLPPSEFDALIDLDDDIVLMEPVTTTSSSDTTANSKSQESTTQKSDVLNQFLVPSLPLITRPIIKRRKTVIHSSKGRYDLSIELKDNEQSTLPTSSVSPCKEKQIDETSTQASPSATNQGTVVSSETESPINNKANETLSKNLTADTSTSKAPTQKKLQNKAALGQQLLEAIGLQKTSTNVNSSTPQTEAATSSPALPNTITMLPSAKQSVHQIRSALKKSLKQAQEQQQQRKKELCSSATNTIIQDADSTTKSVLKEIVVVEGKGNNADNSSSLVDVEEQIDKVTLMVRSNDNEQSEQSSTTTANGKEDIKEQSPITKRRTLLPISGNRKGDVCNSETGDSNEKSVKDKKQDKEDHKDNEIKTEIGKSEKEESENPNILAAISAANAAAKDEVATPKKRGRKRLTEKQNEIEASSANNEKDKDDDTEFTSGANKKEEGETTANRTPSRPTRQSKTLSKYYKGPDKPAQGKRSLPSRTTRNRKYS